VSAFGRHFAGEANICSMTHFRDYDIPLVWHRLNEVQRTNALQDFFEKPQWQIVAKTRAYIDFMQAHLARIPDSQ
jgi:hypothetical protein